MNCTNFSFPRQQKLVIVRQCFVEISGSYIAGQVLSLFDYWTSIKGQQSATPWLRESYKTILNALMGACGKSKLIREMKRLIDLGFLQCRRLADNSVEYLLDVKKIQGAIARWGGANSTEASLDSTDPLLNSIEPVLNSIHPSVEFNISPIYESLNDSYSESPHDRNELQQEEDLTEYNTCPDNLYSLHKPEEEARPFEFKQSEPKQSEGEQIPDHAVIHPGHRPKDRYAERMSRGKEAAQAALDANRRNDALRAFKGQFSEDEWRLFLDWLQSAFGGDRRKLIHRLSYKVADEPMVMDQFRDEFRAERSKKEAEQAELEAILEEERRIVERLKKESRESRKQSSSAATGELTETQLSAERINLNQMLQEQMRKMYVWAK